MKMQDSTKAETTFTVFLRSIYYRTTLGIMDARTKKTGTADHSEVPIIRMPGKAS